MSRLTLAERVAALHAALESVPHAFGGALALGYYAEPRATIDIDLNVFVPATHFAEVAGPLGRLGAETDEPAVAELVRRDGQARVMWDSTPIDLFFAYDPFHEAARAACRMVPFADGSIPILAPEHLIVCKAVFNRGKDWVDIDSILDDGTVLDAAEILRWTGRITGDEDARYSRLAAVLTARR